MSTNYYAIKKVDKATKEAISIAVENENWILAQQLMPEKIHIGKSSVGWDFLFNHNGFEHYKNIDEMFKWLEGCQIVDEYGEEITPIEFIHFVNIKIGESGGRMNNPEWYIREKEYVFSTSTEFS